MATSSRQIDSQTTRAATGVPGLWWKSATVIIIAYVIYGAFFIAGGAVNFAGNGNIGRIIFFHVPVAVLSSVVYFVGAVYAFHYLTRHPDMETDAKSAAAMELGFMFCILATVTGSVFAAAQWGSYWNWDPRETSIVIMLLLYAAYLLLRGATGEDPVRRARLSAVYALVALVPGLFLIWVMPRLPALQSLHPPDTIIRMDRTSGTYKMVLYPSFLGFTMLFIWLFQMRLRCYHLCARRSREL